MWKKARVVDKFFVFGKGDPDPKNTEALLGYDDDNLYLAVVCPREDMDSMAETDDDSCRSDNVEILLDTNLDKESTERHLWVKTNGRVVNATRGAEAARKIKAAARKYSGRYIVEMSIPFKYIGRTAVPGTQWGMLVARNEFRWDETQNPWVYGSAWSFILQKWNRPDMFAEIHFE